VEESIGWLCCPECHKELRPEPLYVRCIYCTRSWRVRNGIADFTDSRRRAEEDEFSAYAKALPALVEAAQRTDWLEALEQVVRPLAGIGPGMFAYVTDESKGDLIYLMNINPGDKVLDLGCGLGAVSVAIADRGAQCCAIDISHEQAVFTAMRCHQMGYPDVRAAAAGDDMQLPLADGSLDAVVMNGVLEWVPCADRYEGSPESAQVAMLKEVHRVLKRGGQLYVSSKNRYALLHFLGGAPDHVSKRPWVGMLSPRLQTLLTLGRMQDSRARIHSLSGFRRLFEHTGFRERAVYALMPDFRHPKRIVPLSARSPAGFKGPGTRESYSRRLERAFASVLPASLLKHLVHCYGFLLEKP
jgi:ubiquinone/menaquinone biosynthesis C-methylase UbiE